jgi:hypothetical protein
VAGVVDGEACGGGDGATGDDGLAGDSGARDGGVGCAAAEDGFTMVPGACDDRAGAGVGNIGDGGELGADEGGSTTGDVGADRTGAGLGTCVGEGVTVVYWVTIITGGGAIGEGARATIEDFDDVIATELVDTPPRSAPCGGGELSF